MVSKQEEFKEGDIVVITGYSSFLWGPGGVGILERSNSFLGKVGEVCFIDRVSMYASRPYHIRLAGTEVGWFSEGTLRLATDDEKLKFQLEKLSK